MLVLGIVAVILFGRKLPEVARTVGSSYAQFRKGLSEIQSTFHIDAYDDSPANIEYEQDYDDFTEPASPKFEPPVTDASISDPADVPR